jgi:hypothetical protein
VRICCYILIAIILSITCLSQETKAEQQAQAVVASSASKIYIDDVPVVLGAPKSEVIAGFSRKFSVSQPKYPCVVSTDECWIVYSRPQAQIVATLRFEENKLVYVAHVIEASITAPERFVSHLWIYLPENATCTVRKPAHIMDCCSETYVSLVCNGVTYRLGAIRDQDGRRVTLVRTLGEDRPSDFRNYW